MEVESSRCLWKGSITTNNSIDDIKARYFLPRKPRSFFWYAANTLVVVQETTLTVFFLCSYHLQHLEPKHVNYRLVDSSILAIISSLFLIVYFGNQADPQHQRLSQARQRTLDGTLLAILLRFLAGMLQNLTRSYSSDTVDRLAALLSCLHLLTCDYHYANGRRTTPPTPPHRSRPLFLGGTMSLNSMLCATTLLVSRIQGVLVVYGYVSLAVILFGFWPRSRHGVARAFPAVTTAPLWIITGFMGLATLGLVAAVADRRGVAGFVLAMVVLGVVLPFWKYVLQFQKRRYRGPWEIPTKQALQLDVFDHHEDYVPLRAAWRQYVRCKEEPLPDTHQPTKK